MTLDELQSELQKIDPFFFIEEGFGEFNVVKKKDITKEGQAKCFWFQKCTYEDAWLDAPDAAKQIAAMFQPAP